MPLKYLAPILSGILVGTSYIPFPPWAIFFCFVPLWSSWLKARTYREIFWSGWLTQATLSVIGFNWVSYTAYEFGHLPWPVAGLTLLLFSCFANLQVPLAGWLWFWSCRRNTLTERQKIWHLAICMAITERLFPMIFDWNLGYSWLWARFPAAQLADIVGVIGLSTLTIFLNVFALFCWQHRHHRSQVFRHLSIATVIFLVINTLGWWHQMHLPQPDRSLRVLLVQANIGNWEKQYAFHGDQFRQSILDRYLELTSQGLQDSLERNEHIDFVHWPETAFPESLATKNLTSGYAAQLSQYVSQKQVPLITGAYGHLESTGQITNALYAMNSNGTLSDVPYHKSILLAFGEYLPGSEYFPKMKKWLPEVADFGRGSGPQILHLNGLKLGAQICYEGLFDWFSRDLAQKGAQLIVNSTNDSWYGTWQQPYQHLTMTAARALETRLPLLRATNTGISTIILPDGTWLDTSPMNTPWFRVYQVPYAAQPELTPFVQWSYLLFPLLLGIGFVLLVGRSLFAKPRPS